jgi:cytosine/uracil/thiamine/allantoin permease
MLRTDCTVNAVLFLIWKMASTKTSTPNNKNNGGGTAGDINPSPEWSAVAPLIFLILGAMVLSRYMESIKSFLTIVVPLVAAAAVGYYLYTISSSQPTTTAAAAESVDAKNDKSMVRKGFH